MKRKQIKLDTIKALLARSGNKCAFKTCDHPIFNDDNLYVANLCHIEAFSPSGPRFNQNLSDDDKNSIDNLLFLCYRHHKEVDCLGNYTVDRLREIKSDHEKRYYESAFMLSENMINQIVKDSQEYWQNFEYELENNHDIPEFKFDIDIDASFNDLYKLAHETLDNFEILLGLIDNRTMHKYFESFFIGLPNNMMNLTLIIDHMRIKFLEELIKLQPNDLNLRKELEQARTDFLGLSKTASKID